MRFTKAIYKGRVRIEQVVGKLKRVKRIAQRCEKNQMKFRFLRCSCRQLDPGQIRPGGLTRTTITC